MLRTPRFPLLNVLELADEDEQHEVEAGATEAVLALLNSHKESMADTKQPISDQDLQTTEFGLTALTRLLEVCASLACFTCLTLKCTLCW